MVHLSWVGWKQPGSSPSARSGLGTVAGVGVEPQVDVQSRGWPYGPRKLHIVKYSRTHIFLCLCTALTQRVLCPGLHTTPQQQLGDSAPPAWRYHPSKRTTLGSARRGRVEVILFGKVGLRVVWCGHSMERSMCLTVERGRWRTAELSFPMVVAVIARSGHVCPGIHTLKLISSQFTRNSLYSPRCEISQAGEQTSCASCNLRALNFTAAVRQYLKSQRQKWPSVKQKL